MWNSAECELYVKGHNFQITESPPSHSDKDHKDCTAFLKLDKHRENGTKCRKKHNYQVCSTSLLRSCQDATASITSKLRIVARLITHAPRPLRFNTFFLRPFRLHYALTARLPRSHRAHRDLINSSLRCPRFHSFYVFLSELCFQKVTREDIKARKWEALHNLAPVFMLVLSVW